MLNDWMFRLRCLLRRATVERELDDELGFHVEKGAEEQVRAGYSLEEAERRARMELAGLEQVKESCRDARGLQLWNNTLQDTRYGWRQLLRNPGFAIVAALVLGLGIGANTSIFSFLNAVMLKGLPVARPEELIVPRWSSKTQVVNSGFDSFEACYAGRIHQKEGGCSFSYPVFELFQKQSTLLSHTTAITGPVTVNGKSSGPPTQLNALLVDGQFFATLGVNAEIGRVLRPGDDADTAPPAVVLSYRYWQTAFFGEREAVGKIVRLNGMPFTIAGVAEQSFNRWSPGNWIDLWLPLHPGMHLGLGFVRGGPGDEHEWNLKILARRKAGATGARVESELTALFHSHMIDQAKLLQPGSNPQIEVAPANEALTGIRDRLGEPLYILSAAVALILLIACTNIAGLLTARGAARQTEIAIRLSVGAGRARIVRQLLTESALLGALGVSTGMSFAYALVRALDALIPLQLEVKPNLRVLLFTLAISILAVLLFGLIPALRNTRVQPVESLASGLQQALSPMSSKLKLANTLVVAQVALATIMLFGAGLLTRTLLNLKNVKPGFRIEQLLVFGIHPDTKRYTHEAQYQTLYRTLREQLAALSGVSSVTYSAHPALSGGYSSTDVFVEGRSDPGRAEVQIMSVGPDFLKTMGMSLLAGRNLRPENFSGAHAVALVNQAYAEKFLSGRSPIGLHYGDEKPAERTEIVGLVKDAYHYNLRDAVKPTAYVPLRTGGAAFEVRAGRNPEALSTEVRKVVEKLDDDLTIFQMHTQSAIVDQLLFVERMTTFLAGGFGILALLLTCIGLYGLLSYEVARRTREIGIRLAVGARPRTVQGSVLRETIGIVLIGFAIGTPVALLVTRRLTAILFNVKPADPWTLAAAIGLMVLVSGLAAYIPARRASRVDPMVALRYE